MTSEGARRRRLTWRSQVLLLTKLNLRNKWRQPSIVFGELLAPLVVFLGTVLIRRVPGLEPIERPACHYRARALPSAGLLPFVQTNLCNADNECLGAPPPADDVPGYADSELTQLLGGLSSLGYRPTRLPRLLINSLNSAAAAEGFLRLPNGSAGEKSSLQQGAPTIAYLLGRRRANRLAALVEQTLGETPTSARALLSARFNASALRDTLVRYARGGRPLCQEVVASRLIMMDEGVDVFGDRLCRFERSQWRALATRAQRKIIPLLMHRALPHLRLERLVDGAELLDAIRRSSPQTLRMSFARLLSDGSGRAAGSGDEMASRFLCGRADVLSGMTRRLAELPPVHGSARLQESCADMPPMRNRSVAALLAYFAPLMRGRVVYHAPTSRTRRVIEIVKAPFVQVDRAIRQLGSLAHALGRFRVLANTHQAVSRTVKTLRCLVPHTDRRFVAAASESDLERRAEELSSQQQLLGALVFNETTPERWQYEIRADVPAAAIDRSYHYRPQPRDNPLAHLDYLRGFVPLQDLVDRAIIRLHANDTHELPATYVRQFPYSCYREDDALRHIFYFLHLLLAIALAVHVCGGAATLVASSSSPCRRLLQAHGLVGSDWAWSVAWMLAQYLSIMLMWSSVTALLRVGGVLERSSALPFLLVMHCHAVSQVALIFGATSACRTSGSAAFLASFLHLGTRLLIIMFHRVDSAWSTGAELSMSLASLSALGIAMEYIGRLERSGIGLQIYYIIFLDFLTSFPDPEKQWSNFAESPLGGQHRLSVASSCAMMLLDTVLYALIGVVIRYIRSEKKVADSGGDGAGRSDEIGCRRVTRRYDKQTTAITGISLRFRRDEICAIVGRNGAGKSTLVQLLSGVEQATSGRVLVGSQSSVGVCPQQSALFELLSVEENLAVHARVKLGEDEGEWWRAVEWALVHFELERWRPTRVEQLSGGWRRRLQVAIAFCGGSTTVVLDEPTSAIDPDARHNVWRLIAALKRDRHVVLTTHRLDEAERVAQRVALLHRGRLLCCGSPLALRKRFHVDSARLLRVESDCTNALAAFHRQIALIAQETTSSARLYRIDSSESPPLSHLADAFASSDARGSLAIRHLSLGEALQERADHAEKSESVSSCPNVGRGLIQSRSAVWRRQIVALLRKRWRHYRRNMAALLSIVVIAPILLAMTLAIARVGNSDASAMRLLNPSAYGESTFVQLDAQSPKRNKYGLRSVYHHLTTEAGSAHAAVRLLPAIGSERDVTCACESGRQTCERKSPERPLPVPPRFERLGSVMYELSNGSVAAWLMRNDASADLIDRRYGGWSLHSDRRSPGGAAAVVWFNNRGMHALPSFLAGLDSALLRATDANVSLTTTSRPLASATRSTEATRVRRQEQLDVGTAANVMIALTVIPATACRFVVRERAANEKRLQILAGLSPLLYWGTSLLFDYVLLFITLAMPVCIAVLSFVVPVEAYRQQLSGVLMLAAAYGFAVTPLAHLFTSRLFRSAEGAFAAFLFVVCFSGSSTATTSALLAEFADTSTAAARLKTLFDRIFLALPSFSMADGMAQLVHAHATHQRNAPHSGQFTSQPLSILSHHLIALLLSGAFAFALNVAIDWLPNGKRVAETDVDCQPLPAAVVVRDLSKTYGSPLSVSRRRPAVERLSFGVERGECFGLLGFNGAGKTTVFKLLTGELGASSGHISLSKAGTDRRRPLIGYCPQADGIDELLTPRELLGFYARLHSMSDDGVAHEVDRTLDVLELHEHADKLTGQLSGGNRRKVCIGIALLGNPHLVLLDEPTCGLDASARRAVARLLRQDADSRSVVLTSHSVDECAALCSRMAIMRSGRIQCIGSALELKSKLGGHYRLTLRCTSGKCEQWRRRFQCIAAHLLVGSELSAAVKKDSSLVFQLALHGAADVAKLLHALELSQFPGCIESLTPPTLEQVFSKCAALPTTIGDDEETDTTDTTTSSTLLSAVVTSAARGSKRQFDSGGTAALTALSDDRLLLYLSSRYQAIKNIIERCVR